MTTPTPHGAPELPGLALARLFHETYERLAPQFGYTTRPETREFDPESPNGKLMTAVCAAIQQAAGAVPELPAQLPDAVVIRDETGVLRDFDGMYDADQFYMRNSGRMVNPQFLFCYAHPLASQPKAPAPVPAKDELPSKCSGCDRRCSGCPMSHPDGKTATAPVPVVQGEAMNQGVTDNDRGTWCATMGGAGGDVGAVPVRQIKQNPLWSSLWMDASQDEYDRAAGEKRIVYLAPVPEQATTGSGQGKGGRMLELLPKLILPLKAEYFNAIKAGTKTTEYRRHTFYWQKRLDDREYSGIVLTLGYPKVSDTARRIERPWNGFTMQTIQHPHFGPDPVYVYAIDVSPEASNV